MSTAIIRIDIGASVGTEGESRVDGTPSTEITVRSRGTGKTHDLAFWDVYPGSAPTLTRVDSKTWTFTPSDAYGQSFGLELVIDQGLASEVRTRRKYAIPTETAGLVMPLFAESADPTASLDNDGAAVIAASTDNTAGNWRGWLPRLQAAYEAIEAAAGGVAGAFSPLHFRRQWNGSDRDQLTLAGGAAWRQQIDTVACGGAAGEGHAWSMDVNGDVVSYTEQSGDDAQAIERGLAAALFMAAPTLRGMPTSSGLQVRALDPRQSFTITSPSTGLTLTHTQAHATYASIDLAPQNAIVFWDVLGVLESVDAWRMGADLTLSDGVYRITGTARAAVGTYDILIARSTGTDGDLTDGNGWLTLSSNGNVSMTEIDILTDAHGLVQARAHWDSTSNRPVLGHLTITRVA